MPGSRLPWSRPVKSDMPLGQGQKILMVDDEIVVTQMFGRLLKRLNYLATTSNSPLETLALYINNPDEYDLVITDLTMPEMNGLELARQLCAIRPSARIVLFSGFTAILTQENLSEAGICRVLDKPVSITTLQPWQRCCDTV
ncbi:MAG: response regulator [Verrucomicrobiota bacterium]